MEQFGFDLSRTYVHLGLGARATVIPDFRWDDAFLERYEAEQAADGDEGRLVMIGLSGSTWSEWERHPAGDELVVLLGGHTTLVQDLSGEEHRIELHPGEAVINPRGVWHTADVHEPSRTLFVTPGRGTEHRRR